MSLPPAQRTKRSREKALWPDWTRWRDALALVLLVRLAWGVWGIGISVLFPDTPLEKSLRVWPPPENLSDWGLWAHRLWVSPWMRYDYEYYEAIVTRGYRTDDGTASFHPLYPLLSKAFYFLCGNAQASLLLASTLSATACCVLLSRYVREFIAPRLPLETRRATVQGSAWALLLGPLGWVLLAPYTEGTFIAATIAALWAARCNRLWAAGAFAAVATLTRQQGIVLLAPLAWQWWQARRPASADSVPVSARRRDLCALGLPVLAYASYSLYRVWVLGEAADPSRGMVPYLASWVVSPSTGIVLPGSRLSAPWTPLLESFRLIPITPSPYHLWIDLVLGWVMALVALGACKYLRPRPHVVEVIFSVLIVVSALCFYTAPYMSLPRHVFIAWILPVAVAVWTARAGRTRWVVELLAVSNLLLFSAYVRHGWVP
jgi:hypothetical protein